MNGTVPTQIFSKYENFKPYSKSKFLGYVPTGDSCSYDDDCSVSSNKCCKIKSINSTLSSSYSWVCSDASNKTICLDTKGYRPNNSDSAAISGGVAGPLIVFFIVCWCYCRCKK